MRMFEQIIASKIIFPNDMGNSRWKGMQIFVKPSETELSHRKLERLQKIGEIRLYYLRNPIKFIEEILGATLFDYQKYCIASSWTTPSAQLYFSNICALITAYTNIDMSAEDSTMVSYDILQEAGIIEAILGYLKDDIPEWTRIWKLVGDDFYEEHFTTRGFLEKLVRKITHWIVDFKKKASETLSEVIKDPKLQENLEVLTELYGASKSDNEE